MVKKCTFGKNACALLVLGCVLSWVQCQSGSGKSDVDSTRQQLLKILKTKGLLTLLQGFNNPDFPGFLFNKHQSHGMSQKPVPPFIGQNPFQRSAMPPPRLPPPQSMFNGIDFPPSMPHEHDNDEETFDTGIGSVTSAIGFAPHISPFDPSFHSCGLARVVNFVANGRPANDHDWPWHVQLVILNNEFGESETFCGATVVSPYHVVTAAHCYDDMDPELMAPSTRVLFRGIGFGKKPFEARAHKVILHKDYVPAMTEFEARIQNLKPGPINDLALIVLRRLPDEIIRRIIPACLPDRHTKLNIGTVCKVMGHGFMNPTDEASFRMPSQMQLAEVTISNNQDCRNDVESQTIKDKINERTACIRGPIQPCVGDSGGPLVCTGDSVKRVNGLTFDHQSDEHIMDERFKPRRYYLMGITSFAVSTDKHDKCGQFKSAVFTLTTSHHDWIRAHIHDKSLLP